MWCGDKWALFGDNLAPISDTTIASALTQESKINDVVRSRLPYSLIAGGISAVLFIIFGKLTADVGSTVISADGSTVRALVLLIVPVIMIVLMKKGLGSGWNINYLRHPCNRHQSGSGIDKPGSDGE